MQNLVTDQSVPADLRPDDAVADLADVGDSVADVNLLPGEPLRTSRFVEPGEGSQARGAAVDEGDQVVSIALDAQRGLGGRVRAGQRVGVVISIDQAEIPDDENPGQTRLGETLTGFVLNDIPVVEVSGEGGEGGGGGLMVSLSVDQSEAGRIVFGAEHGRIWLTEQNEQTVTAGGRIRTRDNIYQGTNEDS
jgi:pilus assembly protein CpaB